MAKLTDYTEIAIRNLHEEYERLKKEYQNLSGANENAKSEIVSLRLELRAAKNISEHTQKLLNEATDQFQKAQEELKQHQNQKNKITAAEESDLSEVIRLFDYFDSSVTEVESGLIMCDTDSLKTVRQKIASIQERK